MPHLDIALLVLLATAAGLLVISRALRVPYPIVLVLGGAALGFVPNVPGFRLPSDAILLLILPPLLFYAGFIYQVRRLKENAASISFLAIGLLVATTVGVAFVVHMLGMPWGPAFVLGAVLSPTDPVAATTITARLGAPHRVTAVIEGESLVNDGTALVIYAAVVSAVVTGHFSWSHLAFDFPMTILGGVAVGLAVAWFISWALLRRLSPGYHNTVLVLFSAYLTYLPAELLGVSGVLAAVTGGIYIGSRMPTDSAPTDRIAGYSFFDVFVFLINAIVFILMGFQFPVVLSRIQEYQPTALLFWGTMLSLALIVLRLVWTLVFDQVLFRIMPAGRAQHPQPTWRESLVIGWAGMRGAVSLAAAQAIPLQLASGAPFPARDLILFFTFTLIFVTVVLQGLSLPLLVRALGLSGRPDEEDGEVRRVRLQGARAALERLDELREEDWLPEGSAVPLRDLYEHRSLALAQNLRESGHDDEDDYEARHGALQRLRRELIATEREVLLRARDTGEISDNAMRRVERHLDLEESRFED